MSKRLAEGGVAVVTGGSSGIGRTIALALATAGWHLGIVGRDRQHLATTLAAIRETGNGEVLALALDVTRPADMAAMADACLARFGRIDLLIASAGIGRTGRAASRFPTATKDLPREEWQGVIDVNLHGVFFSNRAVLPAMLAQGAGEIINICSSTTPRGLRGRPLAPAYCASKFAVAAYTEALASELESTGVRVSAIFPGPVETPLIANTMLDGPFGGRIAQDSFAAAVLAIIATAGDVLIPSPHILPMPAIAGRRRGNGEDTQSRRTENAR